MSTFARENFSDQLSIETPEGVALHFPVAGIGSRGIAVLIDHLIQFACVLLLVLAMVLWEKAVGQAAFEAEMDKLDTWGKWFVAFVILLFFCLWWGYFAFFEAFWRGQTPGKRLLKLRVIKDSGRQITFFEAMARNLMRVIDNLPSVYLTGVITMAVNKQNKRLGDMVAGTLVVHEAKDEQPMVFGGGTFFTSPLQHPPDAWTQARTADAASTASLFPADALSRLVPQDLLVIDTFFARVLDLPMDTRESMAQRVAATMCAKMGVPVPPGNPERALEAMLQGARQGGRRFGSKEPGR